MNASSEDAPNNLLASDHAELDEMLDELFLAFDTNDAGSVFKKLDLFWARLAMHVRAEHLHLFPAILEAVKAGKNAIEGNCAPTLETAQSAIEQLRGDHDFFMRELSEAIKQMREISESDAFERLANAREKVAAVRRRLEAHNEAEEAEIYVLADKLLSAAESAALSENMLKELDNLPPRFRNL